MFTYDTTLYIFHQAKLVFSQRNSKPISRNIEQFRRNVFKSQRQACRHCEAVVLFIETLCIICNVPKNRRRFFLAEWNAFSAAFLELLSEWAKADNSRTSEEILLPYSTFEK